MLVSVLSVVALATTVVQGAPQSGYVYPESTGIFTPNAAETQSSQQIVFPETQTLEDQLPQETLQESNDEEFVVTTDEHHENDHDHHHHHDHHLGLEWLREAVPGEPGVDYPIYWQVPKTSFNCRSLPAAGYYADIEAGCQVFHVCNDRGDRTFLCPNGTIFNQEHFTCQWWFNVDCKNSIQFYRLNINIGAVAEETQDTVIFQGEDQVEQREQEFPLEQFETEQEFPRVEERQESVQQRNIYDDNEALSTSFEDEQQTVPPPYDENKEISEFDSDQESTKINLLLDEETVPIQDTSVPPVQGNAENIFEEKGDDLENVTQENDYVENKTEAANINHIPEHIPAEQNTNDVSYQENITTSVQESINDIVQVTDEVLVSQENNLTQNTEDQEAAYDTTLKETDKILVEQEDIDYDSVVAPVSQNTTYVLDQQQTNNGTTHQYPNNAQAHLATETDFASQDKLNITNVQFVSTLIEDGIAYLHNSQETDIESVQSQDDLISVEDTTDYYVPQEADSFIHQETNHQEQEVDQTQQEVIYTSGSQVEDSSVHHLNNHTTFSDNTASTPYQQQEDSSPVQLNFDNVLNHQEGSEDHLEQENGNALVHHDSETYPTGLDQESNYNPVLHETLYTNGQQETGSTLKDENVTISTAQDVANFTPSQEDTKYNPGQNEADESAYTSVLEETDDIPVQQEESYSPSQQETHNTHLQQQNDNSVFQEEDSFSPVQDEYEDTSVHHEVGYTPVYEEINPNTAHQAPDFAYFSQANVQEKSGYVPIHQETDHTSAEQKPEYVPIHQETDHTSAQQTPEFDFIPNQEEIDHPSQLQGTVSDSTQEDQDYTVNQQVTEEQQNDQVVLNHHNVTISSDQQNDNQGLILQETLFDTVQAENEDVSSQQGVSENAFGQDNYNDYSPVYQEVLVNPAEGEFSSFDQQTPEHFSLQQEHSLSNFQQNPSSPVLEPELISIHQESQFDSPSQEAAYPPVQDSDFSSVPHEQFSSVQQESDYYVGVVPEISAVRPEQETSGLPESFPEVIPEAESPFDISSATVPEISLLYGVPVVHTISQTQEITTEHLPLPKYAADTTGNHKFIAPGLLLINPEDAVSVETSQVPSDFLTSRDIPVELKKIENFEQKIPQIQSEVFDELQEKSYQDQPPQEYAEVDSEQIETETELPINSHHFLIPENSGPFHSGLISTVKDHASELQSDIIDYEQAYNDQNGNNVQVTDSPLLQTDEENITEIPLSIENVNSQDQFEGEAFDTEFNNIADEQLTDTESPDLFITEVPIDADLGMITGSPFNIPSHNLTLNNTKNENLLNEEDISIVTQLNENNFSPEELQVNTDANEIDDINTSVPIVQVFPKGNEDPVLSLFFKGQADELTNNRETIFKIPQEEFNTEYNLNEESTVSAIDDQVVLETEDTTIIPEIQEYTTIPVNELNAPNSTEESDEVRIYNVEEPENQLTPLLDEQIQKNTETNIVLQTQEVPYSSLEDAEETNVQPHIPYGTFKQPIDRLPQISSLYLPPQVA